MKKVIVSLLVLTTLLSCNSNKEQKNKILDEVKAEKVSSEFDIYVSTLNQITIPLKVNPWGEFPKTSNTFHKKGYEKYKLSWTSQPLGIYYKDESTIGIIDCSVGDVGLVPFLITYDLKGNKIDSTGFYKKSGRDLGYEAIEHVTFNANKTIVVLDTIKRWSIDEDKSDIVEGSMKMTTGKVEYRILKNGKIEHQ